MRAFKNWVQKMARAKIGPPAPLEIALKNAAFRAEFAPAGEINSAIATILSAIERELLASRLSEDAKTSMIKPKRV